MFEVVFFCYLVLFLKKRHPEISIDKDLGEENSGSKAACSPRDQRRKLSVTWEKSTETFFL